MPEQLSLDEVNKIIEEAFAKVNPTSSKDMGLIMKEVSPKLKGKAYIIVAIIAAIGLALMFFI